MNIKDKFIKFLGGISKVELAQKEAALELEIQQFEENQAIFNRIMEKMEKVMGLMTENMGMKKNCDRTLQETIDRAENTLKNYA